MRQAARAAKRKLVPKDRGNLVPILGQMSQYWDTAQSGVNDALLRIGWSGAMSHRGGRTAEVPQEELLVAAHRGHRRRFHGDRGRAR